MYYEIPAVIFLSDHFTLKINPILNQEENTYTLNSVLRSFLRYYVDFFNPKM